MKAVKVAVLATPCDMLAALCGMSATPHGISAALRAISAACELCRLNRYVRGVLYMVYNCLKIISRQRKKSDKMHPLTPPESDKNHFFSFFKAFP